jgi:hypothetical protein
VIETADEKQKTFLCYESYLAAIDLLPDCERWPFWKEIAQYAMYGEKPPLCTDMQKMAFTLISPNIDSCNRRYKTSVENGKKGGNPNFKKGRSNPYYKRKKITQDNLNKDVNKDDDKDNPYLHKDSVSCGSPLNAEPPSTQSTGDPFAKSKLRKFLEEKERGAGETDAK